MVGRPKSSIYTTGIYVKMTEQMKDLFQSSVQKLGLEQSSILRDKAKEVSYSIKENRKTLFDCCNNKEVQDLDTEDLFDLLKGMLSIEPNLLKEDFIDFINYSSFYDYKKREILSTNYLTILEIEYRYLRNNIDSLLDRDYFDTETKEDIFFFEHYFFEIMKEEFNTSLSYLTKSNLEGLQQHRDDKHSTDMISLSFLEEIFNIYKGIIYIKNRSIGLSNIRFYLDQKFGIEEK